MRWPPSVYGCRGRHPSTLGGQRITGAGQGLSFTRSCWRAASHSCSDTIGGVFIAICPFGCSLSLSLLVAISNLLWSPRSNDGHLPRHTTQLELIPLRRCRRTLDSISLNLREVQLRPHRCRQAREATEAASQSLQRSGPPLWRMRVQPLHQVRYAD